MDETITPTEPEFLTIQEAAQYVGVSTQTLRRWDVEGKVKSVRHPTNRYRYFNQADLEPLRLEYKRAEASTPEVDQFFMKTLAHVEGNDRLREPQQESHRKIRAHFEGKSDPAILQIPVGCGKTGIMATLPFGIARGRVLIIAPNVTIRNGVASQLDIANPKCFWRKAHVLESFEDGPFVAILDGPNANIHDCTESHFVVTNIQQLASAADRWLPQFPKNFFDMILVDEGHHNVADSWRKVFDRFPAAKVISLTATPFRGDGKELTGTVVYHYSYAQAMMNGYIKQLHSINAAPAEIFFTYRDDDYHHTLDEVMELREEAWFRKGVALAPECNRHIVEASINRLLELRKRTGHKHQIIAVACSIDHARQVCALYEERGVEARAIYGEMDSDKKEKIFSELRDGRIDCIVQVQMLGEGFDHPPLSVAAIFRPFRSLSPYVQFVGRIMRVIVNDDPNHPDNQGFILSHVGLNNDANWRDFLDFDLEDRKIFHRWVVGADSGGSDGSDGKGQPRRFDEGMLVHGEILSDFIGASFLSPDDDRVLENIMKQKVPGTPFTVADLKSKEELQNMLRQAQPQLVETSMEIPVSPQRRRQEAQTRLRQRTNSVVARVLKDLQLSLAGYELARAVPGAGGGNNRSALTRLINNAINERLGISKGQRNQTTANQNEEVFSQLDEIGDQVRDMVELSIKQKHV